MARLIVYNIEYCEGITGIWWEYLKFWRVVLPPRGLDIKIANHLKSYKPDILALVEVDTGSLRGRRDEVMFFKKALGMRWIIEKIKYPVDGWLKLFHFVPILRMQANAILSKNKLTNVKYHVLHEGTKRVVIEASICLHKKVTLLLAHLSLGKKTRRKQIKELCGIVNDIKNPVILMGDFNTFLGSAEINELLSNTHLSCKFKNKKAGFANTQPAVRPRRALDYVLTSEGVHVKRYVVLNFKFSDHLPVLVDFDLD